MGASNRVQKNQFMNSESSFFFGGVQDYKAKDVDLSVYKGKVLLVVNVASKCGLTDSNYTQLTELYNKYKDRGFEILAFPCNQFLKQEPGSSEQAQEFACTRYKAEYPIFHKVKETIILGVTGRREGFPPATAENPQQQQHEAKNGSFPSGGGGSSEVVEGWVSSLEVRVNGPDAAPVYKFLKAHKSGFLGSRIKWNFTKFLVDKEGTVLARYGPTTAPLTIEADIQKALGDK
ncbi:putative glutathione peroxidase 5 [Vitis vinifera]|uniref:Glutathione peroxidase n=1 Tax=Vitis vinifera TaxID=29760 RepID=A0A438KIJ4_VITVI|nr:putative glutathione peroxidase 5 [Vitis vinifera]